MMMKVKPFKWLIYLLIFLGGPSLKADEVIVSVTSWEPYISIESGCPGGPLTEVVKTVFKEIGYKPVFRVIPWKRGLHEAKVGRLETLFPVAKTDERLKAYYFPSQPLTTALVDVFSLNRGGEPFERKNLEGERVGVLTGAHFEAAYTVLKNKGVLDRVFEKHRLSGYLIDPGVLAYCSNWRPRQRLPEVLCF